MVIVLFGLSGAGKNYVGKVLKKHFSFHFWDTDAALPQDMKQSIKNKQPFTQKMRDDFTTTVIQTINQLQELGHKRLVIAQALYKEENRKQILNAYPHALLLHVDAVPEVINNRLKKRSDWVDENYAAKIQANFENLHPHKRIVNNQEGDATIIEFLRSLCN